MPRRKTTSRAMGSEPTRGSAGRFSRVRTTSIPALRRLAVTAQSYPSRFRLADADDVEAAIRRAMCIQLDTVTAVERSHRIAIGSRVGLYPRDTVSALMREGRIIEGWAHALCLLPAEDWPLYAWSRASMQDGVPWHGDVKKRYPGLADRILGEIRERGALGSKDFAGQADPAPHRAGTSSEAMWSWKPAKQMLDALFASGELVIAGRVNFHRLYDLPERVLPRTVLDAPVPSQEEAIKALIVQALRARGALSEFAIAEHIRPIWYLKFGGAKVARPYRLARRRGETRVARSRRRQGAGRRRGRSRARPTAPERCRSPVAVRQPPLGLPVRDAHPRVQARNRAVQAGAAAALRLLRPAVPVARQDRRAGGPEVGAEGGRPRCQGVSSGTGRSILEGARRGVREGPRPSAANRRTGACDEGRPLA